MLHAADGSRDANTSVEALASFVLGLADDADGTGNAQLATALVCESLSALEEGNEVAGVLPRTLSGVGLPSGCAKTAEGRQLLSALRGLLAQLAAGVEDKMAAKLVTKMIERVDELLVARSPIRTPPGNHAPSSAF